MTTGNALTPADDVAYLGSEAKALGDGRVGGYLVRFGVVDVQGDLFDPAADFGLDASTKAPIYYHHGVRRRGDRYSELFRNRRIGAGEVKTLDDGLWIEGQIDLSRPGAAELYADVESGRMGWSSGTSDRFVAWEPLPIEGKARQGRRITAWPLNDASLTPTPVESRNRAVTMKAIVEAEVDELLTLHESTDAGPGAVAASPDFDDRSSRLVADRREFVALALKMHEQRRAEGRDLSVANRDALKALLEADRQSCREIERILGESVITPAPPKIDAIDPAEFKAIILRGRAALHPSRRK